MEVAIYCSHVLNIHKNLFHHEYGKRHENILGQQQSKIKGSPHVESEHK